LLLASRTLTAAEFACSPRGESDYESMTPRATTETIDEDSADGRDSLEDEGAPLTLSRSTNSPHSLSPSHVSATSPSHVTLKRASVTSFMGTRGRSSSPYAAMASISKSVASPSHVADELLDAAHDDDVVKQVGAAAPLPVQATFSGSPPSAVGRMLYFLTVMDEWLRTLQGLAAKDKIEPAVAESVQVRLGRIVEMCHQLLADYPLAPSQVLLKYWDQWKAPKKSRMVRKNSMYYRKLQKSKGAELCKVSAALVIGSRKKGGIQRC
jgi:hypothetical protein